jgi:hypothetical protein
MKVIKNKIQDNNHRSFHPAWVSSVLKTLPLVDLMFNKSSNYTRAEIARELESNIANKGHKWTIERWKAFRLNIQQHFLRQQVTPIPYCKADSIGQPRILKKIFKVSNLSDLPLNDKRYILSVLRIIDTFTGAPEIKINTITDQPHYEEDLVNDIIDYIPRWYLGKALKKRFKIQLGRPVLSNRAGPNGPCSLSMMLDLEAIAGQPDLLRSIKTLLGLFCPHIAFNPQLPEGRKINWKHSKLCFLSDIAMKTRVVAIADYWSNQALIALHDSIMELLRSIKTDVTFRQDQLPDLVKGLGSELYSSDMTAFTDRFPRILEVKLLEYLVGPEVAQSWEQVMVDRDFRHQYGNARYSTGNPMGILSSWPVSTLTHHLVKHYCAYKLGKKRYKYLILGDDTLDTSKQVYTKYLQVIESLGVSISRGKCTKSENGYAEFAKRLFTPDGEITGLPTPLMQRCRERPEYLLEVIRISSQRGIDLDFSAVDSVLKELKAPRTLSLSLSLPTQITGLPSFAGLETDDLVNSIKTDLAMDEFGCDKVMAILREARRNVFLKNVIPDLSLMDTNSRKTASLKKLSNNPFLLNYYREAVTRLEQSLAQSSMDYFPMALMPEEGCRPTHILFDSWMQGKLIHLAKLPDVRDYMFRDRGLKAAFNKYKVLKEFLYLYRNSSALLTGSAFKPEFSDMEIFNKVLERTKCMLQEQSNIT